jgi:hypothetical protein
VLSHAIGQVLENCMNNTNATGLPLALAHLSANAQRKAEHDAKRAASGHGTNGSSPPGGPMDHGPGADHGRSSGHGHDAEHGRSSEHRNPHS